MLESIIFNIIYKYNLFLIPLRTIINNKCSCGQENCRSPGKHPQFSVNWKILASKDKSKINYWIKKFGENINFAVPTGRISSVTNKHLIVLDIDEKEHSIINLLPPTFCYKTGGGGYHYWFWSEYNIKNSVSLIANKVDIRGTGGYVVVPPSKHISGKKYEILSNTIEEIVDLPDNIVQLLNIKKSKEKSEKELKIVPKQQQKGKVTDLLNFWNSYSIPEIRDLLHKGTTIPEGTRNEIVFRLLCSDRAKGALLKNDLINQAIYYRSFCQNSSTFSGGEIDKIVSSVMKYPAYNNSCEKVTENYIKWKEKNGLKKEPFLHKKLNELDDKFFNSLKQAEVSVSLETVIEARKEFFKNNGLSNFSNYKPSLFAKKLRKLGFTRTRTAKCNYWNVDMQGLSMNITNI